MVNEVSRVFNEVISSSYIGTVRQKNGNKVDLNSG
jgi:hypothetical protein